MKRRWCTASAGFVLAAALGGLVTYKLANVPFGTAFALGLNISLGFLSLALLSLTVTLFRSQRPWLRWTAAVPLLAGAAVVVVQIAVQTDQRVLHYKWIPPAPTSVEWQEDARFLADEMVRKHPNVFAHVDSATWYSATDSIVERIPELSNAGVLMELTRLAGLPRDGHTFPFIMAPCFDIHSFPIVLYGFPEGWYVVRGARGLSDLEGSQLLSIQGRPIQEIYDTFPQLIAWENEQSRKEHFTFMTVMAEWLAYHGLITGTDEASFTFLTAAGDTVMRSLSSVPFWPYFLWASDIPIGNDEPPVFTAPRKDAYTYRLLDKDKALYIQFNQCVDQPGAQSAAAFALGIEQYLRDHPVERCIIDLRNNDGGQRTYTELLRVVRDDPAINHPGRLFVLTGRRTFSAAVMFATELQLQTNAIFIGEPTGQGPIFYSRPQLVELPRSGLLFGVSSYHNVAGLPFDERRAIEPDIPVPYGIDDFLEGRDPVLTVALTYEQPARTKNTSPSRAQRSIIGRYHYGETLLLDVSEMDGSLHARITDAIPNTTALFTTDLHEVSPDEYRSRLRDVTIHIGGQSAGASPTATLDWMGRSVTFTRAPDGFEVPFERMALGDVAGGCLLLRNGAERYKKLYPSLESLLNRLGYQYLRGGETNDALRVFGLNLVLYPLSANVYDSYGEALMVDGQIDSSIASYRRSLELNPENKNAERVIQKLQQLKAERSHTESGA